MIPTFVTSAFFQITNRTLTPLQNAEEAAEIKKRRTFRKFSYRGIDLDQYVPR
jgi:hypothetical protein